MWAEASLIVVYTGRNTQGRSGLTSFKTFSRLWGVGTCPSVSALGHGVIEAGGEWSEHNSCRAGVGGWALHCSPLHLEARLFAISRDWRSLGEAVPPWARPQAPGTGNKDMINTFPKYFGGIFRCPAALPGGLQILRKL